MPIPLARRALRLTPLLLTPLLLGVIALPEDCAYDPFPVVLDGFPQSASVPARWFAPGFDNGVQDCADGEIETDHYASWPLFETFALRGSLVTRCERPDGLDRLRIGAVVNLTDNLTIEGCLNPSLNLGDYSGAADWFVTEANCFDGQQSSFRVVAGRIRLDGGVDFETVLVQGQQMDDGLEYVDPRFVIPIFSMGYDGEQPFFAMGIKVRSFGSQDEPQIAVGLCRRTAGGWVCVSDYAVGQGALADYQDLGAVRADVDCPPGSVLGDEDCAIPATPVLALSFRDVFQQFPLLPSTAIAEGDFAGSAPRFIARQADAIPGLSPRVYESFGGEIGDIAFGRGGGAFSARDDLGLSLVARWSYGDTNEEVIAVEGDPIRGSDAQVDEIQGISYFGGRVAFGNFDMMLASRQIAVQSLLDPGEWIGLYRPGIDVLENADVESSTLFFRGLEGGLLLNGVTTPSFQQKVPVLAVDAVEVVRDGASSLYGSDAVAGVLNEISRRDREVSDSHDLGTMGFEALTLSAAGELFAGSSDPTNAPLYRIDRMTHLPMLVGNTMIPGGIRGLASRLGSLHATNGIGLYMVDPDTAQATVIGDFVDQDTETPVDDISGLSWDTERDELFGVSLSGSVWSIDAATARVDWRLAIPGIGGEPRSLAIGSATDYVVGKEDGRAFQIGLRIAFGGGGVGGYGQGPAAPEVELHAITDTGDSPLAGLALEPVPEPGAGWLGVAALVAIAAQRRRSAHDSNRCSVSDLVAPHRP